MGTTKSTHLSHHKIEENKSVFNATFA